MALRRQLARLIEAAGGQVDLVRVAVILEHQLGAAARAKAALAVFAGDIGRGLALQPAQVGARHAEPGDERRARGAAAQGTVAGALVKGARARFVADCSA